MPIANLNRLMAFHAVAETGSFTGAARALFLTQSGVSKHVRLLEEELSTTLFDRLARRVELTAPGRILHDTTREMIRLIQDAEARIAEADGPAGTLRLAASVTAGTYILPPALAEFRERHERVDVRVDVLLGDEAVRAVLDNAADVGIVGQRVDDERLVVRPFLPDELVAIVPSRHPWARRRSLPLDTLLETVLLLPRPGSGTRRAVEEELARQRVEPRRVLEYGNTEAVMKAVGAGLGVALVSARAAERESAAGEIVGVTVRGSVEVHRHFAAVWRRGRFLTRAATAFIESLSRREWSRRERPNRAGGRR
jgi:DNA-binding transcriptional LysR family regulator